MEIFLVGGAVRDELLGLPLVDRDWLVVGAEPDHLLQQGFKPVGKDFPVFLHPQTKEEYALARKERKVGVGYQGFECEFAPSVTLEEDLLRRDLTINAMVKNAAGDVIDPYGGLTDLQDKKLRHVSEAFVEDPLRVLRAARFLSRFHSCGFSIAAETLSLMRSMCKKNCLHELSAERVWIETIKAMNEPNPEVYFYVLADVGGLLPWYKQLAPLTESSRKGLTQLILSAEESSSDRALYRLLCCSYHFIDHASDFFKALKAPKKIIELSQKLQQVHADLLIGHEPNAEGVLQILKALDSFRSPGTLEVIASVCRSISRAKSINTWDYSILVDSLNAMSAIDNQVLLAQGFSGRELGQEIDRLRLVVIRSCIAV